MIRRFINNYGKNELKEKTYELKLNLTNYQIQLLINSTSDLGKEDKDRLIVQQQIIIAALNTEYFKDIQ